MGRSYFPEQMMGVSGARYGLLSWHSECDRRTDRRTVTGHFGHKTLRHQKSGTRHFDTSAVIEEKPGHFDPGQFR